MLIFRVITVRDSSLLKIVDFTGGPKDLEKISSKLISILDIYNAEYFDFLVSENFKLDLKKTNFLKKTNDDVVPSYYEPLIIKNFIHMCGFINKGKKNFYIFKGDGDSERPNKI